MNSIKKILISIITLTCALSFAQVEIRGTVISESTGKVPEEEIYVKELITKQISTLADSLGNFRIKYLEPNKEYLIEISGFGIPTQKFKVKTNMGITNEVFVLKVGCEFNVEKAESDWKIGAQKLLIFGSIAPVGNTKADNRFEKKYKIEYFDFGCSPPAMDCMKLYNERIFELMDKKYGKSWRKRVRTDVEYLN